jgi:hypothetical protein
VDNKGEKNIHKSKMWITGEVCPFFMFCKKRNEIKRFLPISIEMFRSKREILLGKIDEKGYIAKSSFIKRLAKF